MSYDGADWNGLRSLIESTGVDLGIDWDGLSSGQQVDQVPQELDPYLEEYEEQVDSGETMVAAVLGDEDDPGADGYGGENYA
jgi:hypothetical protein